MKKAILLILTTIAFSCHAKIDKNRTNKPLISINNHEINNKYEYLNKSYSLLKSGEILYLTDQESKKEELSDAVLKDSPANIQLAYAVAISKKRNKFWSYEAGTIFKNILLYDITDKKLDWLDPILIVLEYLFRSEKHHGRSIIDGTSPKEFIASVYQVNSNGAYENIMMAYYSTLHSESEELIKYSNKILDTGTIKEEIYLKLGLFHNIMSHENPDHYGYERKVYLKGLTSIGESIELRERLASSYFQEAIMNSDAEKIEPAIEQYEIIKELSKDIRKKTEIDNWIKCYKKYKNNIIKEQKEKE